MQSLQISLPLFKFHNPSPLSTRAPNSLSMRARGLSKKPDSDPDPEQPQTKPKRRRRKTANQTHQNPPPFAIPKKQPRRGRRSEAAAVEDYVRDTLNRTFAAIRDQNPEIFDAKAELMNQKASAADDDGDDDDESEGEEEEAAAVVEEETENWPADAEVGWGIRASEYFEKHGIRNVVDENGDEIDWEGEVEDNWVKEINCLEWESFAFHPSPLIVFVFERYNRAAENWKALKELEKAVKVYWNAKDRLPPRSVKIDINIERDLAYALKVRECPQVLFLRGNKILYREKEIRTSDELVAMIAHFYYNAKRPSWIDVKELTLPY